MEIRLKIKSFYDEAQAGDGELPISHDSIGQYWRDEFEKRVANETDEWKKKLQMALFDWRQRYEGADNSSLGLDKLSIKNWGSYVVCTYRDLEWVKGAYSLFDTILLPAIQNKIVLNKPVDTINWADSTVKVTCKDGEMMTAEVVVVTCSLGYLKFAANSMFVPALPAEKQYAIRSFGYGTNDKIFLRFENPFWEEDCDCLNLLWLEETNALDCDLEAITGSKMRWWRGIIAFDTVVRHRNLLVGWIAGEAANAMELCTDEQVLQVCWKLLLHFIRRDVERPSQMYRSFWNSEPYMRGSYSHLPIGFEMRAFDDMITPVVHDGQPKVFFAGEAYNKRFYSSLHGAFQNGEQQAAAVLQHFNMGNSLEGITPP